MDVCDAAATPISCLYADNLASIFGWISRTKWHILIRVCRLWHQVILRQTQGQRRCDYADPIRRLWMAGISGRYYLDGDKLVNIASNCPMNNFGAFVDAELVRPAHCPCSTATLLRIADAWIKSINHNNCFSVAALVAKSLVQPRLAAIILAAWIDKELRGGSSYGPFFYQSFMQYMAEKYPRSVASKKRTVGSKKTSAVTLIEGVQSMEHCNTRKFLKLVDRAGMTDPWAVDALLLLSVTTDAFDEELRRKKDPAIIKNLRSKIGTVKNETARAYLRGSYNV